MDLRVTENGTYRTINQYCTLYILVYAICVVKTHSKTFQSQHHGVRRDWWLHLKTSSSLYLYGWRWKRWSECCLVTVKLRHRDGWRWTPSSHPPGESTQKWFWSARDPGADGSHQLLQDHGPKGPRVPGAHITQPLQRSRLQRGSAERDKSEDKKQKTEAEDTETDNKDKNKWQATNKKMNKKHTKTVIYQNLLADDNTGCKHCDRLHK